MPVTKTLECTNVPDVYLDSIKTLIQEYVTVLLIKEITIVTRVSHLVANSSVMPAIQDGTTSSLRVLVLPCARPDSCL